MAGWIMLHRSLLNNPIFQNEKLLKMFIWCLLKAAHREYIQMVGLQAVKVGIGQFVYGRITASEFLGFKQSTTNKLLETLKKLEMIEVKSNNKYSLVSVVNWELYQTNNIDSNNRVTTEEQQSNNRVTTKEQQSNTNNNIKKVKKDKKDKKVNKNTYGEYVNLTPEEHQKLIEKYGQPSTDRMIEILDNYKGASGKKYVSDYRAILQWVVEKQQNEKQSKGSMMDGLKQIYDEEMQNEQNGND